MSGFKITKWPIKTNGREKINTYLWKRDYVDKKYNVIKGLRQI